MKKWTLFIVGLIGLSVISGFLSPEEAEVTPYPFQTVSYFPKMPRAVDNPVTVEGAELGRFLFYDPILSRDSTFSCATCHQQKNAFAGIARFETGIDSTLLARNTMPLFNLAWNTAFFWDGRAATLEEQVFHPVRDVHEMDLDWETATRRIRRSIFYPQKFKAAFGKQMIDSVLIAKAIAQFERTLISTDARFDSVLRGEAYLTPLEYEGFGFVNDQVSGNCLHCHITDGNGLGTNGKFSNNGLDLAVEFGDYADGGRMTVTNAPKDAGFFRVPSFRNLLFTAPYMHDGRFETLEEVLDFYSEGVQKSYNIDSKMARVHEGGVKLTPHQKKAIIVFLKTMSDSVFTTNPAFGNPFSD